MDPLGVIARLWKPWPLSVMDAVAQSLDVPSETFEAEGKDFVFSALNVSRAWKKWKAVWNTNATKFNVFLSGGDGIKSLWQCDHQGLLDSDESFGCADVLWVFNAVGMWPCLTHGLFCTPREKDAISSNGDVDVTHVCGKWWFSLQCFKFWVLVVCFWILAIYIYSLYISSCITQTVYPP